MMRYRPSRTSIIRLLLIMVAVLIEITVLTPLYDRTFAEHRGLKERLKAAEQQQSSPLSIAETRLYERLTTATGDDQATLQELDTFRAAARLENVSYSIGPWQPTVIDGRNYTQQRLELAIAATSDTQLWPFLHMIVQRSRHWSQLTMLRVDRSIDTASAPAIQATAVITFYHADYTTSDDKGAM
jgi:hypothetical protein